MTHSPVRHSRTRFCWPGCSPTGTGRPSAGRYASARVPVVMLRARGEPLRSNRTAPDLVRRPPVRHPVAGVPGEGQRDGEGGGGTCWRNRRACRSPVPSACASPRPPTRARCPPWRPRSRSGIAPSRRCLLHPTVPGSSRRVRGQEVRHIAACEGIQVVEGNPAWTSPVCPPCSHVGGRFSPGGHGYPSRFRCGHCGWTARRQHRGGPASAAKVGSDLGAVPLEHRPAQVNGRKSHLRVPTAV